MNRLTEPSKEKRARMAAFAGVSLFILIGMSAYIFYRTSQFAVWNALAYFETCILIFACLITVLTAKYLITKDTVKLEVVFTGLVLSLGLLYLLVITPMSVPDELYHYSITYKLSNILMLKGNDANLVYTDMSLLEEHRNVEGGYSKLLMDFGGAMPENVVEEPYLREAAYYLCYIPQVIGILLGRLLNRNFITLFVLGRICNLIFYAGCVYIAIKRIPHFKILLGSISIMPMALQQAASFSTDSFINGLSFILIALAFQMFCADREIERREIVFAIVVAALLAPAKVVYCAIILLFFAIEPEKLGGKKRKIKMLCTMVGAAILLVLVFQLPSILKLTGSTASTLNWEGQQNYNLAFVVSQPVQTVKIFLESWNYWDEIWFKQAFGSTLSGLSLFVNEYVISAYILVVLLCALQYPENGFRLNMKIRAVSIMAIFAVLFLSMTSMFLDCTSNTRSIIVGMQGRYFIPVLPLFAMQFANRDIRIPAKVFELMILVLTGLNVLIIAEVLRYTLCSIVLY